MISEMISKVSSIDINIQIKCTTYLIKIYIVGMRLIPKIIIRFQKLRVEIRCSVFLNIKWFWQQIILTHSYTSTPPHNCNSLSLKATGSKSMTPFNLGAQELFRIRRLKWKDDIFKIPVLPFSSYMGQGYYLIQTK